MCVVSVFRVDSGKRGGWVGRTKTTVGCDPKLEAAAKVFNES